MRVNLPAFEQCCCFTLRDFAELTFSVRSWHPWVSHSTSWWCLCTCSRDWAYCRCSSLGRLLQQLTESATLIMRLGVGVIILRVVCFLVSLLSSLGVFGVSQVRDFRPCFGSSRFCYSIKGLLVLGQSLYSVQQLTVLEYTLQVYQLVFNIKQEPALMQMLVGQGLLVQWQLGVVLVLAFGLGLSQLDELFEQVFAVVWLGQIGTPRLPKGLDGVCWTGSAYGRGRNAPTWPWRAAPGYVRGCTRGYHDVTSQFPCSTPLSSLSLIVKPCQLSLALTLRHCFTLRIWNTWARNAFSAFFLLRFLFPNLVSELQRIPLSTKS